MIALQINNWNEQNNTEKLKQVQLTSLKQDLKDDIEKIKETLDGIRADSIQTANLNARLQSDVASLDTLINIIKTEFNPFVDHFDGFNNFTYQALVNSGGISVFDEAFKKDLSELSILQNKAQDAIDTHFEKYLGSAKRHMAKYPNLSTPGLYITKGPLYNKLWINADIKDLIVSYNDISSAKLLFNYITLETLGEILAKTEYKLYTYFNDDIIQK